MNRIDAINRMLKSTVIYQVGELVVSARSSFKNCILLPWRLYKLHTSYADSAFVSSEGEKPDVLTAQLERQTSSSFMLSALILSETKIDKSHITALLDKHTDDSKIKADALIKSAKVTAAASVAETTVMCDLILEYDHHVNAKREVILILHKAGHVFKALELIEEILEFENEFSPAFSRRVKQIQNEAQFLRTGFPMPSDAIDVSWETEVDVLYAAAMSIPYHTTGYATRTHSLLKAMHANGIHACCVTRFGYPWDRADARQLSESKETEVIENVRYQHLAGDSAFYTPLSDYVAKAASAFISVIEKEKPKLIIAGSDYVNALPALMAAKQTGVRFGYDMRGLWEHTAASKIKGWEHTDRFLVSRQAETLIAAEADIVFTISEALGEEMMNRGVDGEKITILQNSVDMERFDVNHMDVNKRLDLDIPQDAIVFGFTGSIEPYEGTDDLVRAFKKVIEAGIDAYLLIVGDGSYSRQLGDLVASLDIASRIRLTGRVPFSDVLPYCNSCDVFVYPRKRSSVTELVPALKPLEAMALKKPVIISNVRALAELVGGAENAIFCAPENEQELAEAMKKIAKDDQLRTKLGDRGLNFVRDERNWNKTVQKVAALF